MTFCLADLLTTAHFACCRVSIEARSGDCMLSRSTECFTAKSCLPCRVLDAKKLVSAGRDGETKPCGTGFQLAHSDIVGFLPACVFQLHILCQKYLKVTISPEPPRPPGLLTDAPFGPFAQTGHTFPPGIKRGVITLDRPIRSKASPLAPWRIQVRAIPALSDPAWAADTPQTT